MNLCATIDLYGGGPGSGPNAPCPQCGHHFQEGDRVKLKPGAVVTNPKSGDKTNFKSGTVAVVTNMLPKIGTQEQLAGITSETDQNNGKFGNIGYVKVSDMDLHQPRSTGDLPQWSKKSSDVQDKKLGFLVQPKSPAEKKADIQPVPAKQIIMHTTTSDGASLTWVKPADEPSTSIKTAKEIASEPHRLKGDFGLVSKLSGVQGISRIYDTHAGPAYTQQGPGTTVHVDTKTSGGKIKNISVEENNYTTHSQRVSQLSFHYKNAAAAVGMLKTRYGIKTSLARLRN